MNFDQRLKASQTQQQYHDNKVKGGRCGSSAGKPRPYAKGLSRREYLRQWREKNKDHLAEYRRKNEEHIRAVRKVYYEEHKDELNRNHREYVRENKEKENARSRQYNKKHRVAIREYERRYRKETNYAKDKVRDAIKSGKLIKKSCEVCGNEKVQAHHDDYNKPLEIRWLCRRCHSEWHRKNSPIRYREESDGK